MPTAFNLTILSGHTKDNNIRLNTKLLVYSGGILAIVKGRVFSCRKKCCSVTTQTRYNHATLSTWQGDTAAGKEPGPSTKGLTTCLCREGAAGNGRELVWASRSLPCKARGPRFPRLAKSGWTRICRFTAYKCRPVLQVGVPYLSRYCPTGFCHRTVLLGKCDLKGQRFGPVKKTRQQR